MNDTDELAAETRRLLDAATEGDWDQVGATVEKEVDVGWCIVVAECDKVADAALIAFCREHAIMHEAQLAGGFARRIAEAGDAYLVGAVVEAVANLTAFVDRWPDHDRMTDR